MPESNHILEAVAFDTNAVLKDLKLRWPQLVFGPIEVIKIRECTNCTWEADPDVAGCSRCKVCGDKIPF